MFIESGKIFGLLGDEPIMQKSEVLKIEKVN